MSSPTSSKRARPGEPERSLYKAFSRASSASWPTAVFSLGRSARWATAPRSELAKKKLEEMAWAVYPIRVRGSRPIRPMVPLLRRCVGPAHRHASGRYIFLKSPDTRPIFFWKIPGVFALRAGSAAPVPDEACAGRSRGEACVRLAMNHGRARPLCQRAPASPQLAPRRSR